MIADKKAFSRLRFPRVLADELRDCTGKPAETTAIRNVIVDVILREKILPDDAQFNPRSVDHIYVTKRSSASYSALRESLSEFAPKPAKPPRDGYEEEFYNLFWDKKEKPIIFVLGQRGCGKSTFLEHFFRGDCYWMSKALGTERERDYRLKLRIHLNLRNEEGKTFTVNFWEKARQSLAKAFRNRCAMPDQPAGSDSTKWELHRHVDFWRRALDLDDPTQVNLYRQRAATTATEYDAEVLAAAKHVPISDEQWVKDALAFFGRHPEYFAFLVIVMDNLDQSRVEDQKDAIKIAKNLVRDYSLQLYRVIIPLWPSSFDALQAAMQPWTEEATRFELPGLDPEEYYSKRFAQTEAKHTQPGDREEQFALEYARDFYQSCRKNFFLFFDSFAGDDIRLRQSLVITTLTNPSLIRAYKSLADSSRREKTAENVFVDIGEYMNFSSLFAGQCDGHHRTLNPIANIFYASESDERLNLLLGIHILWLLDSQSDEWILRATINEFLLLLGHKRLDIDHALAYFEEKDIIRVPHSSAPPESYFINRNFVKSYFYLAGLLAYLDNMAMVTPMSAARRTKIAVTTSNRQFMRRKQSTLVFLDEVRDVEAAWFGAAQRCDVERFIGVKRIPSVFLTLCAAYEWDDKRERSIPRVSLLLESEEWDRLEAKFREITQLSYAEFEGCTTWNGRGASGR